jgi:methyl-accepting chemotaxis protein
LKRAYAIGIAGRYDIDGFDSDSIRRFDMTKKVSLGTQLALCFAVVVALEAVFASFSFSKLDTLSHALTKFRLETVPSVDFLLQADRDLQQQLVAERSLFIVEPGDRKQEILFKEFEENRKQSAERLEKLRPFLTEPESITLFNKYLASRDAWEQTSERVLKLIKRGIQPRKERQ